MRDTAVLEIVGYPVSIGGRPPHEAKHQICQLLLASGVGEEKY